MTHAKKLEAFRDLYRRGKLARGSLAYAEIEQSTAETQRTESKIVEIPFSRLAVAPTPPIDPARWQEAAHAEFGEEIDPHEQSRLVWGTPAGGGTHSSAGARSIWSEPETMIGTCSYRKVGGAPCLEMAEDGGMCGRHARWDWLAAAAMGIPCPEDRGSMFEALSQTLSLLLAHKIDAGKARAILLLCREMRECW